MKTDTKIGVLILSLVAFAASCGGSNEDPEGDALASIHTEGDRTIEFARTVSGAIAVSEVGPAEVPSKIVGLAAQEATALEVFLALAPDEEVPIELEINHAAVTNAEPRDLSLSFRSYTDNIYSTSCTYSADHGWFEDTYDGTGWSYSDYFSGTDVLHGFVHRDQHLISHVCNYSQSGGTNPMRLNLYIGGVLDHSLQGIDVGERGITYVLGSSVVDWWSIAWNHSDVQTNVFRHGIMAPG
jgi:hypothetical protein